MSKGQNKEEQQLSERKNGFSMMSEDPLKPSSINVPEPYQSTGIHSK